LVRLEKLLRDWKDERNVIDWRLIGETFERGKMHFAVTPLL
jgi:hypothetical protein